MAKYKDFYITTRCGGSGFFAVMMCTVVEGLSEEYQDIYQTGFGRYKSSAKAAEEAKEWAAFEEVPYKG